MPLVWIGGKFWRPPFMNPLDGGSATKISPSSHKSACQKANEQWESLNLKTRFCDCFGSKGQNMDQGSMDPHFGPIPWTPCHGPGPWILFYFYRKVLDRVHEHSFLNNKNWTKTEIVQKKRFDKMLFISLHTLLTRWQSQDCSAYALQYKDSHYEQAEV